ncbi:peroxiredoxin [Sinobacterium caligoides]|uniref:Glutathione-dependent peroxiredoxin n=1 Tax=Sinobacterium caligoides TaxID=933926 RepID=A0A3N2DNU2_9GAMM|nr:peroxiredoxin [Sinobacterium caligoides]ROS01484.1 peroxiredoxin [Sinobacterium caligoides]
MQINVGDKLPNLTLKVMGDQGPEEISIEKITAAKKVVWFAVPGAFTPGCSNTHLPGYVVLADEIKAKGVDHIVCLSVNDAFVMGAWGKAQNAEALIMLADGNGELTEAMGLTMDASGYQMGARSQRYAMIIEDGVVTHIAVEPKGGIDVSAAEKILTLL